MLISYVKADPAGDASLAFVFHDLDAHGIEFLTHFQAFFRACGYATSASFAIFFVYENHLFKPLER
jgi:hypothetical protein